MWSPALEKEYRATLCGADEQSARFEIFRYTPFEDMAEIFSHKDDPQLSAINNLIKQGHKDGNWEKLLNTYRENPHAHMLLMAAYSFGKPALTAHELVTAFDFLSVAMDDKNFKILRPGDKEYEDFDSPVIRGEVPGREIPDNEKVLISVPSGSSSELAREHLTNLFNVTPGAPRVSDAVGLCRYKDKTIDPPWRIAIASASMSEALVFNGQDKKLTYNFGFPSRRQYIVGIFEGQHPTALLRPNTQIVNYVHGARVKGGAPWVSRHDLVHQVIRNNLETYYKEKFHNEFYKTILVLQDILDAREAVDSSLIIEAGFVIPHLEKSATVTDLATRLVDELLISYLDGETHASFLVDNTAPDLNALLTEHLETVMSSITISSNRDPNEEDEREVRLFTDEEKKEALAMALSIIEPKIREIVPRMEDPGSALIKLIRPVHDEPFDFTRLNELTTSRQLMDLYRYCCKTRIIHPAGFDSFKEGDPHQVLDALKKRALEIMKDALETKGEPQAEQIKNEVLSLLRHHDDEFKMEATVQEVLETMAPKPQENEDPVKKQNINKKM